MQQLEEEFERGFRATGQWICRACAGEDALGEVIDEVADDHESCSYCDQAPAGSLDDLILHMLKAIRLEYRSASEESPSWDGREGGYQAPEYYLIDLLFDELREEFGSRQVYEGITEAIVPYLEPWFEREWYALRPDEQILASWQRFARLAIRRRPSTPRPPFPASSDPDEWIDPQDILDTISDSIADLPGIYRVIAAGTPLWRARRGPWPGGFRSAKDLGPPLAGTKLRGGRMNRENEIWFYGAFERRTAIAEISRPNSPGYVSVGAFATTRRSTVLDLTGRGLALPSIYDLSSQHLRIIVRFLAAFAREISQPVRRRGSPQYIPTQLVTDYVRTELKGRTGHVVDGIAFPSARIDGNNVVLFVGAEACSDEGQGSATTFLTLAADSIDVHGRRQTHNAMV
jgi:hypothetical protein